MRTVEVQLYQYSELSDKAKAKARDWYREASQGDNYFSESVIEDAIACGECMGIAIGTYKKNWCNESTGKAGSYTKPKVYWSGFWSQGDGASYVGDYAAPEIGTALENIKAHAPVDETLHAIATRLDALQAAYSNRLVAEITQSGHYVHARTMHADVTATNAEGDDVDVGANDAAELEDALRAFADWIYRQLESEYEYINSDENVAETIEANEYEFEGDGTRAAF